MKTSWMTVVAALVFLDGGGIAAASNVSIYPVSGFGYCSLGGCPSAYTGAEGRSLTVALFQGSAQVTSGTATWQITAGDASPMTWSGLTFTFIPRSGGNLVVSAVLDGQAAQTLALLISPAPQSADLSAGRVHVTVEWQNPYSGETGTAWAIPQQDQLAYFFYADPTNPEVFVKVLDFQAGSALCFVGGLTDFYYKVTFTMLRTGQKIVFEKPPYQFVGYVNNSELKFAEAGGTALAGVLAGDSGTVATGIEAPAAPQGNTSADALATAPQSLLFSSGRVLVTVDWRNPYSGETGRAYGIPKADQYGFFYYADPDNPEVFVKVLDFGAGSALVFVGGLTDFYYKVTFWVARTGQLLVFEKPEYQYIGYVNNSTLRF